MVGWQQNDSMTQTQKLIAGCVSGVTTRFITQPMDVIKIRCQLLKKRKSSNLLFRIARRIFREEGITAFWHGHCLGQMHSILAVSSQFYVYEVTTKYAAKLSLPKEYHHFENFVCGTAAGCVCTALVIPLEVIRVRQILVKDQYKSIISGARAVYRYGGPLAFYEGLSASLLQMGPQVGITFAVFSFVQPLILSFFAACPPGECGRGVGNTHQPKNLAIASSVAGSMSGFIAKTVTYPFDLAKRRLQIGGIPFGIVLYLCINLIIENSHRMSKKYVVPSQVRHLLRCTKLIECLVLAYKKEGVKGLFRGWTVTVYKAQMTSVVAFTTYELMCYAMRELDAK